MSADRLPDPAEQVAVLIRKMMALPNDPGSRRDMKAAGREALALLAGTAPGSAAVSPAEPPEVETLRNWLARLTAYPRWVSIGSINSHAELARVSAEDFERIQDVLRGR